MHGVAYRNSAGVEILESSKRSTHITGFTKSCRSLTWSQYISSHCVCL